ncbi:S-layer homology domain-containing protein [Anaerobacillus sp. MEB173]|uniref:S-layer homology domain-containing protein n=1 Tax=Anaerobacillus sp. MEB173 TaxID=3383345 RepID=UPI003F8DF93F
MRTSSKKRTLSFFLAVLLLVSSLSFAPWNNAHANSNQDVIDYLALGDSLAAGVTPYREFDKGYPDFLAEKLELHHDLNTFNKGYATSGYTSANIVDDIQTNKENIQKAIRKANLITLTVGANDLLKAIGPIDQNLSVDPAVISGILTDIGTNITKIVTAIQTINPEADIYIMGYYNPFPYHPVELQPTLNSLLENLNNTILAVSNKFGVTYVPTAKPFAANYERYLPNPQDIHPSLEGYEAIAEEFYKAITAKNKTAKPIFKDVPLDHPAYADIAFLYENHIISGFSNGLFQPNKPITRAHVAAILLSAVPFDQAVPPNPNYKDVSENHPQYYAIAKLTQAGIFEGTNGRFHPEQPISRAEMAKILVKTFSLTGETAIDFKDLPEKHWAHEYIQILAVNNITTGYTDKTFRPNQPVTRAETAIFISRTIKIKH